MSILSRTFPAAVRSELTVVSAASSIQILKGAMEAFNVKVQSSVENDADKAFEATSGSGSLGLREQSPPSSAIRHLQVTVPERYCTVDIASSGDVVHIESVNEGELTVGHRLGNRPQHQQACSLKLGSIKATDAVIVTEGVSITGKRITGDRIGIHSKGGPISVGQVIGNAVRLNSVDSGTDDKPQPGITGASITLQSVYAKQLTISSGAGISIGQLDCKGGQATVAAHGGPRCPINIAGIDGSADIASTGGDITLQAHEKADHIQVASQGGDISCSISPELLAQGLSLAALGQEVRCSLEGNCIEKAAALRQLLESKIEQKDLPPGTKTFCTQSTNEQVCRITLDARRGPEGRVGCVRIQERSWIDAAKSRIQS